MTRKTRIKGLKDGWIIFTGRKLGRFNSQFVITGAFGLFFIHEPACRQAGLHELHKLCP